MNQLLFVVGLVVVLLTVVSVLFTLVLPRRPVGIERLTLAVNRTVRLLFVALSRLARSYEGKDAILAPTAPVALLAQLLFWAAALTVGFGLMLSAGTRSLSQGLLQSLTALFTVGAVHIGGTPDSGIDIAVGAIWVVIVALQIAYLPAIYGSFNRREGLVALLESRAGEPAWGPELLVRHQQVGIIDTLPDLYADWEVWAADVAESHTTYPILLLFRSPEPWASWMIGLLAVLDAGAMHLALAPDTAPSQARLCLRMGFTLMNRIATSLGWAVDPDPDPDGPIQLTFEEFAQAVAMLERFGFPIERSAEEAWPDFRGWRVNYESVAYRLADRLTVPPAPWSGARRNLRTGVVEPRRPPQRRPSGASSVTVERPPIINPNRGRRMPRPSDDPGG
ncbi:MAG: hypothetical protein ABSF84_17085 [Acidimicrobiales bacterium]|jgi:hypothetical protein